MGESQKHSNNYRTWNTESNINIKTKTMWLLSQTNWADILKQMDARRYYKNSDEQAYNKKH